MADDLKQSVLAECDSVEELVELIMLDAEHAPEALLSKAKLTLASVRSQLATLSDALSEAPPQGPRSKRPLRRS